MAKAQREGGNVVMLKRERGTWCLLRTNGRGTLRLVASLNADGIAAWTPTMTLDKPLPRSRARREQRAAIMPTFVFAPTANLSRLLSLAERPGHHEQFSMFRFHGGLPLFTDSDLEPLRSAEGRAAPKSRRRTYRPGQMVRVPEGSFGGMSGLVEKSDGNYTMVCFGGSVRVKISTFLLREDVPQEASVAARAA